MITNFKSSWLSIKFSLSVPIEMYKERCGENGFWCVGVKVQDQFVWNEWPNEWCGSVAVLKSIYWCKPVLYLTWINKEMTWMISTFPPLVFSCRQEYKERKAAANMPPKPDKSIRQLKRKLKKKKRIDDW